jgi:hypothetical protein
MFARIGFRRLFSKCVMVRKTNAARLGKAALRHFQEAARAATLSGGYVSMRRINPRGAQ